MPDVVRARPSRPVRGPVAAMLALLLVVLGMTLAPGAARARPILPASSDAAGVPDAVTFEDAFDNGQVSGWKAHDTGRRGGASHWHTVGNHLAQTGGTYGGSTSAAAPSKPGTVFVAGDPTWTDYDFSTRLRPSDNDGVGVVFRYRDDRNYYRFSMDQQRHFRRIVKVVDGRTTVLAQTPIGYQPGKTYRIRVVASGSDLSVTLNSTSSLHATDDSLPSGEVGLYTWAQSSTSFDDVSVQATSDFFTLAVVPDTQFESANRPSLLSAQTRWLADHRATERISMVMQEGDIVDTMRSSSQWATARKLYNYLDGKVPFVAAAGNHDVENLDGSRPYTQEPRRYNAFLDSFDDYRADGFYRPGDYRNTYHLFTAGGTDLMVLNLDFGAEDDVLAWAGRVVDEFPHRHVLLLTHDYLGTDGALRGSHDTGDPTLPHNHNPAWNDGVQMWEKFVRHHANVQFTFNGHVIQTVSDSRPWSVARLETPDDAGRPVYQVLTNFQTYHPSGGGFLRLFRVYPKQGRVEVRTYSPYQRRYLTDPGNQFTIDGVDLGSW